MPTREKHKCKDCDKIVAFKDTIRCRDCYYKNLKNVDDTERRIKISKSMKGRKQTKEHRKNSCVAQQKAWTKERRLSVSGEKSPHWKGGYRKDKRKVDGYRVWRDFVFARDEYTCQCCSEVGGALRAHHILPWAVNKELRLDENNGITLCDTCHKKYHRKVGYKNCNEMNLKDFIKGEVSNG